MHVYITNIFNDMYQPPIGTYQGSKTSLSTSIRKKRRKLIPRNMTIIKIHIPSPKRTPLLPPITTTTTTPPLPMLILIISFSLLPKPSRRFTPIPRPMPWRIISRNKDCSSYVIGVFRGVVDGETLEFVGIRSVR